MVEGEVELAEREEQRGDGVRHPLVNRSPAAVDIRPPGHQAVVADSLDLPGVDPREVGVDGLGHESRDRRPGPPQLIVVIRGRGGRVVARGAEVRTQEDGIGERRTRLARVALLALVPDQVPDRQASMVVAIHGLAVAFAPFEGVE